MDYVINIFDKKYFIMLVTFSIIVNHLTHQAAECTLASNTLVQIPALFGVTVLITVAKYY